jgi:hypothetical protein
VQQVILENTSRHPITLVLPHDLVCSEERCICARQKVVRFDHNPETGDQSARTKNVRLPHSIQLFPAGRDGSKSMPLPHVARRAPDVAKHVRTRALRVVDVTEPEPAAKPKPEPDGQGDGSESSSSPPGEASTSGEHQLDPIETPIAPAEPAPPTPDPATAESTPKKKKER